jgi:hypothetical protein
MVDIKITNEQGARPLFAGKRLLVVRYQSDSSIALDDPQLGQLVYDARIGLMN